MAYDFMKDETIKQYSFTFTSESSKHYTITITFSTDPEASDGYDNSVNIDGTYYYYSMTVEPSDD